MWHATSTTSRIVWGCEVGQGVTLANPRDAAIRAANAAALAKVIKRMRYTERQIEQVLRCNSEKARFILNGQLDGFSNEEIRKLVDVLG